MANETSSLKQRLMWILWPAFLMAGVIEMLVFALVDPQDLQWFGHHLEISRQGIYTVSFFVFWFVTSLSGAMTVLLAMPAGEVNHGIDV
jgi:hypothetical protein